MVWNVRLHRADDGDIVYAFGYLWKQVAHFNTALPVFFELERRWKRRPRLALGRQIFHRKQLPRVFIERRFRIESIYMRGAAIGKNMDNAFCFRREVRLSRR